MLKQFYKICKLRLLILTINMILLSHISNLSPTSDFPIWFFICLYCFGVITLFLVYRYCMEEDGSDKVENTMKKEFLKVFLIILLDFFGVVFLMAIFERKLYPIKYYLILLCFLVFFSVITAFFRVRKKGKQSRSKNF